MVTDKSVMIFLLNSIEIFSFEGQDRRKMILISEVMEEKIVFYHLYPEKIIDVDQRDIMNNLDLKENIYRYLTEKYPNSNFHEFSIFEKLDSIADMATGIFFIRHKELTKGGEYVELAYLMNKPYASKTFFLKKEGFDLSTMTHEIMERQRITFVTYRGETQLHQHMKRIIGNLIQ
jgi:hypothetical protein